MADILTEIDATVEGRCAGPDCGSALSGDAKSAYFCSPTCQEAWSRQQTYWPEQVRGSDEVDPSEMRWRPDLVTAFDDTGLTLLDCHHRDDTGLDYCVYTRTESDRAFLRVDDGHRFVGIEVPWAELEASGPSEPFRRLERELGDHRRLDPESPSPLAVLASAVEQATAAAGSDDAEWRVRFNEAMREAGVELGTAARRGAQPTATSVDETHHMDWAVLARAIEPRERLREGDRIVLHWSNAGTDESEVTEARVAEVRPYGTAVTEPVDRSGTVSVFRRVGEQIVNAGAGAIAAFQTLPAATRAAVRAEADRQRLRAVCNDEAMYERALVAADERGMSVPQMYEAVVTGQYIDGGWNDWSCSADVDPSGRFRVPDFTRLDHGTYQLWCSLSDETKVAALRHARDLAAVSRWSQEHALAMILAARR